MLKRLSRAALALALLAGPAAAGLSPQMVDFQGKLLDTSNNPRNGSFSMTFALYAAPTGGTALWTETQPAVSVDNGDFNVLLGQVNPLTTGLFNGTTPYLGVAVAPDAEMTPRQPLLMTPLAFRALLADDLAPGNTSYVQVGTAVQTGAVFHVSSGTVEGPFLVTGASTFTASGAQTYSLDASSGVRVQAGTVRVSAAGGADVAYGVRAATLTASVSLQLPSDGPRQARGVMTFDPTLNQVYVGTGTSNKTLADTDSAQTMTNKTLSSTANAVIDATRIQSRAVATTAPSGGMDLRWSAAASQWAPTYTAASVFYPSLTPTAGVTITADTIYLVPVLLPAHVSLSQLHYRVTSKATGTTGDAGLYDASGNLVADGGANSADFTSIGAKIVAVSGAPVSVVPGQYYFALVCTGHNPGVYAANLTTGATGVIKGLGTITVTAGTGSTLPASITLGSAVDTYIIPFLGAN